MKKRYYLLLSGIALVALVSCTNPTTPNSSGAISSPATSSLVKTATMTIQNASISAGTNFFDGCKPTVIYYDATGQSTDYTNYQNFVTYSVIADSTGTTYGAGDVLPEGSYTAKAVVKSKIAKVSFKVVKNASSIAASEGHGYKTVSNFDNSCFQKAYPNMGALGGGKLPASGSPKIIVIPVYFSGFSTFSADEIKNINSAFFGEASETGWQSLSSYYKKSSYGKLNLGGKVISPYQYNKTTSAMTDSDIPDLISKAIVQAESAGEISRADYDSDKDGWIDGVEILYKTDKSYEDTKAEKGSLWWNFTSCTGAKASVTTPTPYRYFWSRYDYLGTKYYTPDIDCHTMIHENGHMMGLNDYYSYDYNEGPAGGSDMMDMNVGDHNAYSKMQYNWVSPKHIDGSAKDFTLTLNSFTDTGDCVVITPTTSPWNETPYDEYLVLQYYTPTGVNKKDSTGYPEWTKNGSSMGHGGCYEKPGLQVFHVDSRNYCQFGTYSTNADGTKALKSSGYKYTDNLTNTTTYNNDGTWEGESIPAHDNTKSRSRDIVNNKLVSVSDNLNGKELAAVLASGTNGLTGSGYYSSFGVQTNLYSTSEFGGASTSYSDYRLRDFYTNDLKFNDGSTFDWTFSVTAQTFDATAAEGTNSGTISLHFVQNA